MNILLVLFCRIPWRPEYPSRASYQAHSTAGCAGNLGKTVPNQSSFLFAPLLWTEFVGGNYHSWLGRCPPIHCSRDKPTVMHSLRWKYTTPSFLETLSAFSNSIISLSAVLVLKLLNCSLNLSTFKPFFSNRFKASWNSYVFLLSFTHYSNRSLLRRLSERIIFKEGF